VFSIYGQRITTQTDTNMRKGKIHTCRTCGKDAYKYPSANKMQHYYCNRKCYTAYKFSWFGFIFAQKDILSYQQIANHVEVSKNTIWEWITEMNEYSPDGYKISIRRKQNERKDKTAKPCKIPAVKVKKPRNTARIAPKPQSKVFKNVEVDEKQHYWTYCSERKGMVQRKRA
jgi:hypothetical protein